jgi:hypothetical protein
VNSLPTVNVNNVTICNGASAQITAVPSTPGGAFDWLPGGESTSSINVSPNSNTSYSVVYTLNGCESLPASSNVTVTEQPSVTSNSTTICEGETATLTAIPTAAGGTYLWNPGGANTESISVSPASDQTYTVTYSIVGCSDVSSNSIVTVNPMADVTVVIGSASILAIEENAAYQWVDCDNSLEEIIGETAQTYTPDSEGTYAVIINLNGCIDTSDCVFYETGGFIESNLTWFEIYPNPSKDVLFIQGVDEIIGETISIYNHLGQLILSIELDKPEILVDVKSLSSGVYYVNIESSADNPQKWIKY